MKQLPVKTGPKLLTNALDVSSEIQSDEALEQIYIVIKPP